MKDYYVEVTVGLTLPAKNDVEAERAALEFVERQVQEPDGAINWPEISTVMVNGGPD